MAVQELREAAGLLARIPALWVPGLAGGLIAAALWLILMNSGDFFAGRLLIVSCLALLLLVTGMLAIIRTGSGNLRALVEGGARNYFRVLLPLLVILFTAVLVFALVVVTLTLAGVTPDSALMASVSVGIMVPTIILALFADTAAVFEDRGVFDAIRRSRDIVGTRFLNVIAFLAVSAVIFATVLFGLMIVWEAALYDKLEPIMTFTDAQKQALTPDQLLAMIGPDGIWVTAAILFLAFLVLIPVFVTYKACVFKSMAEGPVPIQQTTGEYDSKGRWYKY